MLHIKRKILRKCFCVSGHCWSWRGVFSAKVSVLSWDLYSYYFRAVPNSTHSRFNTLVTEK